MAASPKQPPRIQLKSPIFGPEHYTDQNQGNRGPDTGGNRPGASGSVQGPQSSRRRSISRKSNTSPNIYLGTYAKSRASIDVRVSDVSHVPSPRASIPQLQLEHLLPQVQGQLETYSVEEPRDGFFDAAFYRPMQRRHSELMRNAQKTLPQSFHKNHPLSIRKFLPQQWREIKGFQRQMHTRAGIQLLKSFLGCFIAYIICLVPASRDWLGKYNYIMLISTIVNHPGRSIGSQIDGAVLTILGTISGLGWGAFALWISTSTAAARGGYGGILATFLVLFTAVNGWLRSVFLRFYQAVLCAGIAICYTCLASTGSTVSWRKLFDYGIPFVLGQAISLPVSACVFPSAGSGALGNALHNSLIVIQAGLEFPREDIPSLKRDLAWHFVNLSQAVRDFTIDLSFTRFNPNDVQCIRDLIQAVIRSLLGIMPNTTLFEASQLGTENQTLDPQRDQCMDLIKAHLSAPTRNLISAMLETIRSADSAIMAISGHGGPASMSQEYSSIESTLVDLQTAKSSFDASDTQLINHKDLPSTYANQPEVVELFLFIHPIRQAADKVEAFISKVLNMKQKNQGWRFRPPSHPWWKGLMRTNAQVRHDRGGLTAGFYFRSKNELDRTMADLQSRAYIPATRHEKSGQPAVKVSAHGEVETNGEKETRVGKIRYELWSVLHRLQGFESRFAFKVTLATTLISIPAWLPQSRDWWNVNETWWAVVTVWTMMHPRVGGNLQDLFVRCFCAFLGALWAALANAAARGNPYILGVLAAIFLIPMLHRFTQSSHPRSGIIGCITFAVISLDTYTINDYSSIISIAWTRGLAFIGGIIAAVMVNWILWPFVARHEVRKSLSSMMLHSAILYRSVIAKYIYYTEGHAPGPEDIARSEMLEGRLREGFVRMRQLMELTRHEMRLRAPFNTLPYSALISASEAFFEHLVQVRQSSLYFQPSMLASGPEAASELTSYRRDAVAVILMNLYVLACALRTGRPVPRYLPSAAATRKKLLDRMEVVEAEYAAKKRGEGGRGDGEGGVKRRRWADVYQYAFSGALTDIVAELQLLQKYTEEVCGEVGWE